MSVEQVEIDDALQELRRFCYNEGAFTFTRTPCKNLGAGLASIVADVTVTNTFNGRQKTYHVGHGCSWPAEFSDDLCAGAFGPPPGH